MKRVTNLKALAVAKGLCKMQCTYYDPYPQAGPHDTTRIDEGFIDPELILNLPGSCGEQDLFKNGPYGRMTKTDFIALAESLENGWRENAPVTVFVEKGGIPRIHEGNHRLRAAAYSKIKALVEIRYFGNSQEIIQL